MTLRMSSTCGNHSRSRHRPRPRRLLAELAAQAASSTRPGYYDIVPASQYQLRLIGDDNATRVPLESVLLGTSPEPAERLKRSDSS